MNPDSPSANSADPGQAPPNQSSAAIHAGQATGGAIVEKWQQLARQQQAFLRHQLVTLKQELGNMRQTAGQALRESIANGGQPQDLQTIEATNQQVLSKLEQDFHRLEEDLGKYALSPAQEPAPTSKEEPIPASPAPTPESDAQVITRPVDNQLAQGMNHINQSLQEANTVIDQRISAADEIMQQGMKAFEEAGAYFQAPQTSPPAADQAAPNPDPS